MRQTIQNANASLYFNGSSSLMTSPVVPSPTGFSFAMWMKLTNPKAGFARVMDYSDSGPSGGMAITVSAAMRPELVFYDGVSTTSALPITRSGWVHVAGTYVPNSAKLYINGELAVTDSIVNMSAPTQTLTFGRRSATSANFASVFLSQVVLHNTTTPWTAAQVLALYKSGTIPTGATAVYPLNEGAGSIAYDTSGNGNNGTITSGTWSRDTPAKTRKAVNGNMVYNGDFEIAPVVNVPQTTASAWIDGTATGSSTNNVFGWTVPGTGVTSSGTISFDTTVRKNGTKSIRLSALDATGTALAAQALSAGTPTKQELGVTVAAVLPSKSYTLTCWAKTTNAAASSVYADIREHNGVGVQVITTPTNKLSGTNDWTQLTATVTTNAGTRFIGIILRNTGGGNISDAWFDDIQLYPTTPVTRSAATGRLTATGRSAA